MVPGVSKSEETHENPDMCDDNALKLSPDILKNTLFSIYNSQQQNSQLKMNKNSLNNKNLTSVAGLVNSDNYNTALSEYLHSQSYSYGCGDVGIPHHIISGAHGCHPFESPEEFLFAEKLRLHLIELLNDLNSYQNSLSQNLSSVRVPTRPPAFGEPTAPSSIRFDFGKLTTQDNNSSTKIANDATNTKILESPSNAEMYKLKTPQSCRIFPQLTSSTLNNTSVISELQIPHTSQQNIFYQRHHHNSNNTLSTNEVRHTTSNSISTTSPPSPDAGSRSKVILERRMLLAPPFQPGAPIAGVVARAAPKPPSSSTTQANNNANFTVHPNSGLLLPPCETGRRLRNRFQTVRKLILQGDCASSSSSPSSSSSSSSLSLSASEHLAKLTKRIQILKKISEKQQQERDATQTSTTEPKSSSSSQSESHKRDNADEKRRRLFLLAFLLVNIGFLSQSYAHSHNSNTSSIHKPIPATVTDNDKKRLSEECNSGEKMDNQDATPFSLRTSLHMAELHGFFSLRDVIRIAESLSLPIKNIKEVHNELYKDGAHDKNIATDNKELLTIPVKSTQNGFFHLSCDCHLSVQTQQFQDDSLLTESKPCLGACLHAANLEVPENPHCCHCGLISCLSLSHVSPSTSCTCMISLSHSDDDESESTDEEKLPILDCMTLILGRISSTLFSQTPALAAGLLLVPNGSATPLQNSSTGFGHLLSSSNSPESLHSLKLMYRRIGSFVGVITLGSNRPLLMRDMNLHAVLASIPSLEAGIQPRIMSRLSGENDSISIACLSLLVPFICRVLGAIWDTSAPLTHFNLTSPFPPPPAAKLAEGIGKNSLRSSPAKNAANVSSMSLFLSSSRPSSLHALLLAALHSEHPHKRPHSIQNYSTFSEIISHFPARNFTPCVFASKLNPWTRSSLSLLAETLQQVLAIKQAVAPNSSSRFATETASSSIVFPNNSNDNSHTLNSYLKMIQFEIETVFKMADFPNTTITQHTFRLPPLFPCLSRFISERQHALALSNKKMFLDEEYDSGGYVEVQDELANISLLNPSSGENKKQLVTSMSTPSFGQTTTHTMSKSNNFAHFHSLTYHHHHQLQQSNVNTAATGGILQPPASASSPDVHNLSQQQQQQTHSSTVFSPSNIPHFNNILSIQQNSQQQTGVGTPLHLVPSNSISSNIFSTRNTSTTPNNNNSNSTIFNSNPFNNNVNNNSNQLFPSRSLPSAPPVVKSVGVFNTFLSQRQQQQQQQQSTTQQQQQHQQASSSNLLFSPLVSPPSSNQQVFPRPTPTSNHAVLPSNFMFPSPGTRPGEANASPLHSTAMSGVPPSAKTSSSANLSANALIADFCPPFLSIYSPNLLITPPLYRALPESTTRLINTSVNSAANPSSTASRLLRLSSSVHQYLLSMASAAVERSIEALLNLSPLPSTAPSSISVPLLDSHISIKLALPALPVHTIHFDVRNIMQPSRASSVVISSLPCLSSPAVFTTLPSLLFAIVTEMLADCLPSVLATACKTSTDLILHSYMFCPSSEEVIKAFVSSVALEVIQVVLSTVRAKSTAEHLTDVSRQESHAAVRKAQPLVEQNYGGFVDRDTAVRSALQQIGFQAEKESRMQSGLALLHLPVSSEWSLLDRLLVVLNKLVVVSASQQSDNLDGHCTPPSNPNNSNSPSSSSSITALRNREIARSLIIANMDMITKWVSDIIWTTTLRSLRSYAPLQSAVACRLPSSHPANLNSMSPSPLQIENLDVFTGGLPQSRLNALDQTAFIVAKISQVSPTSLASLLKPSLAAASIDQFAVAVSSWMTDPLNFDPETPPTPLSTLSSHGVFPPSFFISFLRDPFLMASHIPPVLPVTEIDVSNSSDTPPFTPVINSGSATSHSQSLRETPFDTHTAVVLPAFSPSANPQVSLPHSVANASRISSLSVASELVPQFLANVRTSTSKTVTSFQQLLRAAIINQEDAIVKSTMSTFMPGARIVPQKKDVVNENNNLMHASNLPANHGNQATNQLYLEVDVTGSAVMSAISNICLRTANSLAKNPVSPLEGPFNNLLRSVSQLRTTIVSFLPSLLPPISSSPVSPPSSPLRQSSATPLPPDHFYINQLHEVAASVSEFSIQMAGTAVSTCVICAPVSLFTNSATINSHPMTPPSFSSSGPKSSRDAHSLFNLIDEDCSENFVRLGSLLQSESLRIALSLEVSLQLCTFLTLLINKKSHVVRQFIDGVSLPLFQGQSLLLPSLDQIISDSLPPSNLLEVAAPIPRGHHPGMKCKSSSVLSYLNSTTATAVNTSSDPSSSHSNSKPSSSQISAPLTSVLPITKFLLGLAIPHLPLFPHDASERCKQIAGLAAGLVRYSILDLRSLDASLFIHLDRSGCMLRLARTQRRAAPSLSAVTNSITRSPHATSFAAVTGVVAGFDDSAAVTVAALTLERIISTERCAPASSFSKTLTALKQLVRTGRYFVGGTLTGSGFNLPAPLSYNLISEHNSFSEEFVAAENCNPVCRLSLFLSCLGNSNIATSNSKNPNDHVSTPSTSSQTVTGLPDNTVEPLDLNSIVAKTADHLIITQLPILSLNINLVPCGPVVPANVTSSILNVIDRVSSKRHSGNSNNNNIYHLNSGNESSNSNLINKGNSSATDSISFLNNNSQISTFADMLKQLHSLLQTVNEPAPSQSGSMAGMSSILLRYPSTTIASNCNATTTTLDRVAYPSNYMNNNNSFAGVNPHTIKGSSAFAQQQHQGLGGFTQISSMHHVSNHMNLSNNNNPVYNQNGSNTSNYYNNSKGGSINNNNNFEVNQQTGQLPTFISPSTSSNLYLPKAFPHSNSNNSSGNAQQSDSPSRNRVLVRGSLERKN